MKPQPCTRKCLGKATAAVVLAICMSGCQPPQLNSDSTEEAEELNEPDEPQTPLNPDGQGTTVQKGVDFPITRELHDTQGRSFQAEILGRSENDLHVERVADEEKFTLPIAKLGEEDRLFAKSLPVTGKPELTEEEKIAQDPYLNARQNEIDRLQAKLEDLKKEEEAGPSVLRLRRLRKEVAQFEREIAELQKQMDEYRE